MDTKEDEKLKPGNKIDEWANPSNRYEDGSHDKVNLNGRENNAFEGMTGSNYNNTTGTNPHDPDAQRSEVQEREKQGSPATAINHLNNVTPGLAPAVGLQQALRLIKKGGPMGALLGVLTIILSIGGASFTLMIPHMQKQLDAVLNHGLGSATERTAALNARRLKGPTDGVCSPVTIRCRYATISNKQLKNYERAAKADSRLKIETRDSPIPNRNVITSITYDGVVVDPSNYRSTLFKNPSFATSMERVYSPRIAILHDKVARSIQARFKAPLADPFDGNEVDDEARMEKVKDTIGDGDKLGKGNALSDTDNADTEECTTEECLKKKSINETSNTLSEAADEINASDTKAVSSITQTGAKAAGNMLKIGVADDYCTAYGTIKAVSLAAKVARSRNMARMATIFATTGAMIMADGALKTNMLKPEDVTFVGDLITQTYKKEDGTVTKPASDSFGYHWAAHGKTGTVDENASQYVVGASLGGTLASFISSIVAYFGTVTNADSTCRVVNNPLVQGGLLIAGIALLVLPTGAGQAVSASSILSSLAISLASALLPAILSDIVAGKLIDKYTNGEDYGNIWVAGTGVMLSSIAVGRANIPLKKSQVASYLMLNEQTNQLYAQIDRNTLSPFDISSPNTAFGSIYSQFIPILNNIRNNKAYGLMQSASTIVSSIGSNLFSPVFALDRTAKFNHCQDPEINSLDLAADPFCNLVPGVPADRLQDDPDDIMARLIEGGHLDEITDEPISDEYKYLVKSCIQRITPWGNTGSNSTDKSGAECLLESDGAGTPLEGVSDDLKIDMYLHYQDNIIEETQSEGYDQPTTATTNPSQPIVSGEGFPLEMPASGTVSSPYGNRIHPISGVYKFHDGVDIAAGCGTPLIAVEGGTVTESGMAGGWGNRAVIDHGTIDGSQLKSSYNHAQSLSVSVGEQVTRGQQIGTVGTTGSSTGCHLHFQLWINGESVDPLPYISGDGG